VLEPQVIVRDRVAAMTTRLPVIFLVLAACGGGGGGDDGPVVYGAPADASAACALATTYQDFTTIQTQIFQRQCSFMDCHDALAPEAQMDLTGATAHSSLVNVASEMVAAGGMLRVTPNDPAMSYLLVILGHPSYTQPQLIDPVVGTSNSPLLCREKLDAIERWIAAGAPND
jgi:hypothetical protein